MANNSKWVSPLGNLYVTYVFPVPTDLVFKLALHFPQVAAAAVVKTMEGYGVDKKAKLQLKFVNDVFLNDKKLCGVLSRMETAAGCHHYKLMIGIGVNLNT